MEKHRSIKIFEEDYLELTSYAKSKHLPFMIVLSRAVRGYLKDKKVVANGKSQN